MRKNAVLVKWRLPTIGDLNRAIELFVRLRKPRWRLIVEVGEGPPREVSVGHARRTEPAHAESAEGLWSLSHLVPHGHGRIRKGKRLEGRLGRVSETAFNLP